MDHPAMGLEEILHASGYAYIDLSTSIPILLMGINTMLSQHRNMQMRWAGAARTEENKT